MKRSKSSEKKKKKKKVSPTKKRAKKAYSGEDACNFCSKDLRGSEKALFVEEEIGRIFCSEKCITQYFQDEVAELEDEYRRNQSSDELSPSEREAYSNLRWLTLQRPDEIWRERTRAGDNRYTLISEFSPDNKKVWCICICLFLRGEPSFLYLAFTTKNMATVDTYRHGERCQLTGTSGDAREGMSNEMMGEKEVRTPSDGLADAWTEDETIRAQLVQERKANDISPADYGLYQSCLEETLESPSEVWRMEMGDAGGTKLYHFLKHYTDENPAFWYIIVARESQSSKLDDQIEILDAFPTQDPELVDRHRRGIQEVGVDDPRTVARVVH